MSNRGRHAARGFTLLEVLVALAVLAIALAAIIKTASSNAYNSAYLRDRTMATWVAENKLAETQLASSWPDAGETRGSEIMAGRTWFWTLRVKNTPDSDVRQVNVEVLANEDDEQPLAALQAYAGRRN